MLKLCSLSWEEATPEEISEDDYIQIIISEQLDQSHEDRAPIRVTEDEMTPEYVGSAAFKRKLCLYAQKDRWPDVVSVFHKFPDTVRTPLTVSGDTALHVAVNANSVNFVKGLVNLMSPQDLQIQNSFGNTSFCMATISGNGKFLQIMIERHQNLALIKGRDGMLPVHLAALTGHKKIVKDLCSKILLHKMASEDIQRLFFMTINSNMFDKKEKENNYEPLGLLLLKALWRGVREMEHDKIWELISSPSILLFDAVISGNFEVVRWLLVQNSELLTIMDQTSGENILHIAVKYRQSSIFYYILHMRSVNQLLQAVDKEGNNVLHFAARPLEKEQDSSSLRPATKIRGDVAWFKEVEKKVPPELRTMRNRDRKSPKDIFQDTHQAISKEVKEAGKGIAKSGMLVAALVVTVAFAAALTVPGDKTNAWYTVFILANTAALFTSSASLLSFLSNFTTSRFSQSEFAVSLHPSLFLGLILLLISVVTMVIAFAAAAFLIFEYTTKWVAYVVASMGIIPLQIFLLFQFRISDTFLWSRYYNVS